MICTAARGHSSQGARGRKRRSLAATVKSQAVETPATAGRRYNSSIPDGHSAYTLTFEAGVFRSLKALAALRGQSIREFFRQLVVEEMDRAAKRGEMTNPQLERPTPTSR